MAIAGEGASLKNVQDAAVQSVAAEASSFSKLSRFFHPHKINVFYLLFLFYSIE